MRTLAKLLALAGTTGAILVAAAAPAQANHQCPVTEVVCLVTDPISIPIGTPVLPPTGSGPFAVQGPTLCNTSSGDCTDTYVIVPGAYVSSTGGTLVTIDVPAYGVSVSPSGVPTIYFGIPTVPSLGSPAGFTLVAHVPYVPVRLEPGSRACQPIGATTVGPVTVSGSTGCILTITVAI